MNLSETNKKLTPTFSVMEKAGIFFAGFKNLTSLRNMFLL